jgi:hypothetical protein
MAAMGCCGDAGFPTTLLDVRGDGAAINPTLSQDVISQVARIACARRRSAGCDARTASPR